MGQLDLVGIRERLKSGSYLHSNHTMRRVVERNISSQMIMEAGSYAEIIEDYPLDKHGPSCLLLGFTNAGIPMHMQVSRLIQKKAKVITLYIPDPTRWIDFRIRREETDHDL